MILHRIWVSKVNNVAITNHYFLAHHQSTVSLPSINIFPIVNQHIQNLTSEDSYGLTMSSNEDDRNMTKKPYFKTLKEYSSSSTTHGIAYVFENDRLIIERVLWIIVVIIAQQALCFIPIQKRGRIYIFSRSLR